MLERRSKHMQTCGARWRWRWWLLVLAILSVSTIITTFLATALHAKQSRQFWDAINHSTVPHPRSLNVRLHQEAHSTRDATTQHLSWRITSGLRSPDGVQKRVYLINDQFPGPVIQARPGDRLVINVENGLEDESTAIHWHGLHMRGANDMDGAIGITQTPILPGASFTYNFNISDHQHGTFWYHAHDQVQRADGLYGGVVVHEAKEKEQADTVEHLLMIGDWYHRTGDQVLAWYMRAASFGNEPVPDSLLVNGIGAYNCSNAVQARPVDCHSVLPPVFSLDLEHHNVLRVVNTGSFAAIGLRLPGLDLVQADSIIWPGQRLDIHIPSQGLRTTNVTLEIELSHENFKYPNSALTSIQQFPVRAEPPRKVLPAPAAISSPPKTPDIPATADVTILLYSATQILSHLDNVPHGFLNHTSWKPAPTALIATNRTDWDTNQLVPFVPCVSNRHLWVDIVLNNLDEDSHPFHLHGYTFYVLASHTATQGWGSYNPHNSGDPPGGPLDIDNPPFMDTVYVPRRGYVVLRFLADNPGIWMFHCHILWHQASGMAMAFEVGY